MTYFYNFLQNMVNLYFKIKNKANSNYIFLKSLNSYQENLLKQIKLHFVC